MNFVLMPWQLLLLILAGWINRAVSIDMLYLDVRVLDNLTIASRVLLPLPSV